MNKEFNEEFKAGAEESEESGYVYKQVMNKNEKKRTWSVVALVLAILSLALCYFSWVGLVFGLISVVFAVVSRRHLGYFDKITLTALILAIFGVVFSLTGIVFADLIGELFANNM